MTLCGLKIHTERGHKQFTWGDREEIGLSRLDGRRDARRMRDTPWLRVMAAATSDTLSAAMRASSDGLTATGSTLTAAVRVSSDGLASTGNALTTAMRVSSDGLASTGDALTSAMRASGQGLQAVASASSDGTEGALRHAMVIAKAAPILDGLKPVLARAESLPKEEGDALVLAFCEAHRDAPLQAILSLGGLYVKIGQMVSSMDIQLPRPWAESLRSLQQDVPPRPLPRIVEIIEKEFGCTIEEVGIRNLSVRPIGAAAVGQVHTAMLGGCQVAIKVMYPDIERLARLDFEMIQDLTGGVDPVLAEALEAQLLMLRTSELDYRHEAANLRRAYREVAPYFADGESPVRVPEPYDAWHPCLPRLPPGTHLAAGGGLVTRRVLSDRPGERARSD